MVASFPGVMYGPLYYRQLEIEKVVALKQDQGNFEASMILSDNARSDLHWWIENITDTSNTTAYGNCQVTVYSDASLTGWGGVLNSITTGGQWTEDESQNHINYLEILACFLTLKAFCSQIKNCHVKTMIDNATAVSYINSMGGGGGVEAPTVIKLPGNFGFGVPTMVVCSTHPWEEKCVSR